MSWAYTGLQTNPIRCGYGEGIFPEAYFTVCSDTTSALPRGLIAQLSCRLYALESRLHLLLIPGMSPTVQYYSLVVLAMTPRFALLHALLRMKSLPLGRETELSILPPVSTPQAEF